MYKVAYWALTYGILIGGAFTAATWMARTNFNVSNLLQKLAPVQLLVGIFCFIGGILGMFYPLGTEIIIGDLIPAGVAILLGFSLAVTYMQQKPEFLNQINQKIIPYHVPLGILAIATAIVHYFFWGTKNFF